VYFIQIGKKSAAAPKLKVYGISVKNLGDFVTTDKDVQKKVDRTPTDYYLLDDSAVA